MNKKVLFLVMGFSLQLWRYIAHSLKSATKIAKLLVVGFFSPQS